MIRVLISIAPRSYRESLALTLHWYRSNAEVKAVSPGLLVREAEIFQPHMVVCNDESYPELAGIVHSKVEILFVDDLHANISLDGREETIKDVGVDDLLKVLDDTQRSVTGGGASLPQG